MSLDKSLALFVTSDSGAVTVDWVVLTAAITGLGLASAAAVRSGVGALGSDVSASLTSASVAPLGTLGAGGVMAGYQLHDQSGYDALFADYLTYNEHMLHQLMYWGQGSGATPDDWTDFERDNYAAIQAAYVQLGGTIPDDVPNVLNG